MLPLNSASQPTAAPGQAGSGHWAITLLILVPGKVSVGQSAVNLKVSPGALSRCVFGWTGLGAVPKLNPTCGTFDLLSKGT